MKISIDLSNFKFYITKVIRYFLFLSANILDIHIKNLAFVKKDFEKYSKANNISEKYGRMIVGLDFKSKVVFDTVLSRILENKFLIKTSDYSINEAKQRIKDSGYKNFSNLSNSDFNTHNFYSRIYPGFDGYELSVFKFHHGLALFGPQINKYFEGKSAIDGGACVFDTAVILSINYNFKDVISFELESENFRRGNLILNKFYSYIENIKTINLGLWSKEGTAAISGSDSIAMIEYFSDFDSISKNINLTSIDSYSSNHNLNIGYIKLDIEGAEYEAILGSKDTIKRDLPVMSISIYHTVKDFFEIKPLIETIAPNQYDFYIRKLSNSYYQYETYLICVPKKLNINLIDYEDFDIYG